MPSKPQRLFLHVGPHKTGTSSFQRVLAEREEALRDGGLTVWRDGTGRTNAGALINLITRPELITAFRLQGRVSDAGDKRRRRAAHRLSRWAAAAQDDLLISAEAFSHLRSYQEAEWLRELFPASVGEIVPILVRRSLDEWRASRRAQLHEVGALKVLDSISDDALSCNGSWYYDYASLVDFWKQFGTPIVIDYAEAVEAEGTVLPALARAIGYEQYLVGLEQTWLNMRRE